MDNIRPNCFEHTKISSCERAKLFCFHHAGGSASFFADWYRELSPGVNVYPVQLKCRGFEEDMKPYGSLEEAGADIAQQICHITRDSDHPFLFYGHSMGGVLAYLTADILQREHGKGPEHLFVSGSIPTLGEITKVYGKSVTELSDEDFCEFLATCGAVDRRMLSIPQFHQYFLPVIRSDFELTENFKADPSRKLLCGVTVYGGSEDKIVKPPQLLCWDDYTLASVQYHILDGDHFFIKKHKKEICDEISRTMLKSI